MATSNSQSTEPESKDIVTPHATLQGGETVNAVFTIAKLHPDTNVVELTRQAWQYNAPSPVPPQEVTVLFAAAGPDCTVVEEEESGA